MNILVIYDSIFGNTEKIAQVIWKVLNDTIGSQGQAEIIRVSQITIDKLSGLDVLVVGSPTRGFRPTESMAKLLNGFSKDHLNGNQVAAFDTRIELTTIKSSALRFMVDKGGYAANTMAKTLKNKGGNLLLPPEGFLVMGEQGPLKDGEFERAGEWAIQLIQKIQGMKTG
jgi:flavodoxin